MTARQFPLTRELRALLAAQREHTDGVRKALGAIIPHVFHREGEACCSFDDSWRTACLNVGLGQRDPKTK